MKTICDRCGGHVSEVGRLQKTVYMTQLRKLCKKCRTELKNNKRGNMNEK